MILTTFDTAAAFVNGVAERIGSIARDAQALRGRFVWAVPGGATPLPVFRHLAAKPNHQLLDWKRVWTLVGDERLIPVDDARSNSGQVIEHLLRHVATDSPHILVPETMSPLCAQSYERAVRELVSHQGVDLVLLGMGADGHIASLFPGSSALREQQRWYVEVEAPFTPHARITATPPFLAKAEHVIVAVALEGKRTAFQRVWDEDGLDDTGSDTLPARILRTLPGRVEWLVLDDQSSRGRNSSKMDS